jgi:hypothetical protein
MTKTLREYVDERFGGKIFRGSHKPDGKACILEAVNAHYGRDWTDSPGEYLDIRALNDIFWDDALRTEQMLLLWDAIGDWPRWDAGRKQRFAEIVVLRTVNVILPIALRIAGLTAEAEACESAKTLGAVIAAAWAASAAADARASAMADTVTAAAAGAAWTTAKAANFAALDAAAKTARAVSASGASSAALTARAVSGGVFAAALTARAVVKRRRMAGDEIATLAVAIWIAAADGAVH